MTATGGARCIVALWDCSGSFGSISDARKKLSEVVTALGPGDEFVIVQVGGPFDEKANVPVECRMPSIPPQTLSIAVDMKVWKQRQINLSAIWGEVEQQKNLVLKYLPTVRPSPQSTTPLDDAFAYAATRLHPGASARYLLIFSDLIQDSDGLKRDGPPSSVLPFPGATVTALFVPWRRDWREREGRWVAWFSRAQAASFRMFDGSQSKGITLLPPSAVPRVVPGRAGNKQEK